MIGEVALILGGLFLLALAIRAEGRAADRRHEEQMAEIRHQGKLIATRHDDLARLIAARH